MDALQQLNRILEAIRQSASMEDLLLFNSDNGLVLAAATSGEVDKETLGSLASGAGTALGMMCRQFSDDDIRYHIIVTNKYRYVFYQIDGARYLLSRSGPQKKAGYMRMILEQNASAIKELLLTFDKENSISLEGVDVDDIASLLDEQMDSIFGGGH